MAGTGSGAFGRHCNGCNLTARHRLDRCQVAPSSGSHWRGRDNCNDDSIGIELEGLEGERFEEAQYETLDALVAGIAQRYPIRHVAGHEHIAPGRKQDPGPGFDWQRLKDGSGWPGDRFP